MTAKSHRCLLLPVICLLCACGYTGDLYLADEQPAQPEPVPVSTPQIQTTPIDTTPPGPVGEDDDDDGDSGAP